MACVRWRRLPSRGTCEPSTDGREDFGARVVRQLASVRAARSTQVTYSRKYPQPVVGATYGRLTVSSRGEPLKGKSTWNCDCLCGHSKSIREMLLVTGKTTSCGCLAREMTSQRSKSHGLTNSPEWLAWRGMHNRCRSNVPEKVRYYAAKGISVCERWASFDLFLADMGPMPADRRTIDRIDNQFGYEPTNCRWATTTQQNRNKSNNVNLTYDGRTMVVAQWAAEIGMSQSGLRDRLRKMSVDEAMTRPKMRRAKREGQGK